VIGLVKWAFRMESRAAWAAWNLFVWCMGMTLYVIVIYFLH
jgi:hypothetical protein